MTAATARSRPSWAWLVPVWLLVLALQVALYHESFGVQPSGDDFSGLTIDIHRAEKLGPMDLFRQTSQAKNYRPLQSLLFWLTARGSMPEPWFAVRVLNFASMALFGFTMLLWLRHLAVGKVASLIALLVMHLHPTLVAQVAGFDGFSSLLAGAFMWLAAYAAYAWRDRWWLAALASGAALLIGSLIKEYTFAALPLALWALLTLPEKPKWKTAFAVGFTLCALIAGLMAIRPYVVPPGMEGKIPTPRIDPVQIAKNLALFAAVILYFGSTVWVFVERTPLVIASFAASCLATVVLLAVGLWRAWRHSLVGDRSHSTASPSATPAPSHPSIARWITFLLPSFLAASFPANVLEHVSEQYAVGLVLSLALLAALAAHGWLSFGRTARFIAAAAFLAQLVLGSVAILGKVHGIRDCGDRARQQADALVAMLPPDAHDMYIALVFPDDPAERTRVYSVFTMHDSGLLLPGQRLKWTGTLEWRLPGRQLDFERFIVNSPVDVDLSPFDLAILWHPDTNSFSILKPPAPRIN